MLFSIVRKESRVKTNQDSSATVSSRPTPYRMNFAVSGTRHLHVDGRTPRFLRARYKQFYSNYLPAIVKKLFSFISLRRPLISLSCGIKEEEG